MKRSYTISAVLVVAILTVNILFFRSIYFQQVKYQKDIISNQAKVCSNYIENSVMDFYSRFNYTVYSEDIPKMFTNDTNYTNSLRNLELFYLSYDHLIDNILIYDNNNNVLSIYRDRNSEFILDHYKSKKQHELLGNEKIIVEEQQRKYCLPKFHDNEVVANVIITTNLLKFINSQFEKYYIEDSQWQWLIDQNGNILIDNINKKHEALEVTEIQENIKGEFSGFLKHKMVRENKTYQVISAYYPVNVLGSVYGVVFTLNTELILRQIFHKAIFINSLSIVILVIGIFFILNLLKNRDEENRKYNNMINRYNEVVENLPFGLMILDKDHKILTINQEARSILSVSADEDLIGRDISERFMEFKSYQDVDNPSAAFDANQFIYFEEGGNELTVFKKEVIIQNNEEDVFIQGIFDVTSIEKSRKFEAASNNAKSEFLAKMSHEIRTPMNGIVGMVDALELTKLTDDQEEKINIIKKSADLLMNIINDVLDISKIEAGKMQIEEIPFNLREEIKVSIDLFKPIVYEKGLEIISEINSEVPDNLIGDPFRLRQILANLVSNAVKFTHEGKIIISCTVEERYGANVTLHFSVQDTGIGIAEDNIKNIFNQFTQEDESTTRMYGGTGLGTAISKQLVNLMNGEIWVESPSKISTTEKYPGSTFSFTIEVFSNERLDKPLEFGTITEFSSINVLIIAESGKDLNRVRRFFERLEVNYKVYEAADLKIEKLEALYKSNNWHISVFMHHKTFDVFSVVKTMKEHELINQSLCIMLSDYHKSGNYVLSKSLGVDYYLVEPFDHKDIIDILYDNFNALAKSKDIFTNKIKENLRILVAEDNLLNQKVAQSIFQQLNITYDFADDGEEAVQKVKDNYYDVIFMDLYMPEKDGFEATQKIRESGSQVPIIAMTASIDKKMKARALSVGMNDYVTKPVKLERIKNILTRWYA